MHHEIGSGQEAKTPCGLRRSLKWTRSWTFPGSAGDNFLDRTKLNWQAHFPIREEAEDCAGKQRSFVIDCHEGGLGYTVRAREQRRDGLGYVFGAYSETSPYDALGRVREKMKRALAMRHITNSQGVAEMLHDSVKGYITSKNGQTVLVVDGVPLGLEDIARFFGSHEGWEFEIRLVDGLK